uniref:Uncharacterized protein n=1 Tax=viral metagenome TaxID=1070528 RepID=A0A6C0BHE0_9ZZZZ
MKGYVYTICVFLTLIIMLTLYDVISYEKYTNELESAVALYPECDFKGNPVYISKGQFTADDLKPLGFSRGLVGSIKILDASAVDLFEHDYFQGRHLRLMDDEECLAFQGFSGITTSIIVS